MLKKRKGIKEKKKKKEIGEKRKRKKAIREGKLGKSGKIK